MTSPLLWLLRVSTAFVAGEGAFGPFDFGQGCRFIPRVG